NPAPSAVQVSASTYDALGRRTARTEEPGVAGLERTTTDTFDAADDQTSETGPGGETTTSEFDELRHRVRTTEVAAAGAAPEVTHAEFDAADEATAETD